VCKQELATATTCVAAGRELGRSWRAWRRAAGEGNRAGVVKERRVEAVQAGGGAAAAARCSAPATEEAGGQRDARGRRRKGVRGTYVRNQKSLGTSR
jgi:hypothetical protein